MTALLMRVWAWCSYCGVTGDVCDCWGRDVMPKSSRCPDGA
jgi:hypothetical protein